MKGKGGCCLKHACASAHAAMHVNTHTHTPHAHMHVTPLPQVMQASVYRIAKLRPKPKNIKLAIHETVESVRRKLFHLCGRKSLVVADY